MSTVNSKNTKSIRGNKKVARERLVGIETNPGPPKKVAKRIRKAIVKLELAKIAGKPKFQGVKGKGTYIPTRFQRVKGKGGYFGDSVRSLTSTGQALLGAAHGAVGGIGGLIGGIADAGESVFKAITGVGDYAERAEAANEAHKSKGLAAAGSHFYGGAVNMNAMNMGEMNVQFGNGGPPRICHREFIGPVFGSTAFNTTVYRIQPGLSGSGVMWPWGQGVARQFQEYELNGAIVEYVTKSSNFAASSQLGSVMMSTNYDAQGTPLASENQVNNNEYTTCEVPSVNFIHPIECARDQQSVSVRYVQTGAGAAANDDPRFNDVGIFQVSTIGNDPAVNGQIIGDLWMTYDITFLKPVLPDIHAGTTAVASGYSGGGGAGFPSVILNTSNSLPISFATTSVINDTVIMPVGYAGTFQVTISAAYNSGAQTGYFSFQNVGSDITQIPLFAGPALTGANTQAYSGSGPTVALPLYAGGNTGPSNGWLGTMIFSTIAESTANNSFSISFPSSWNTNDDYWTLVITAVDSSIVSVLTGAPGRESSGAKARRLEIERVRRECGEDRQREATDIARLTAATAAQAAEMAELRAALAAIRPFEPDVASEPSSPPSAVPILVLPKHALTDVSKVVEVPPGVSWVPSDMSKSLTALVGDYVAKKASFAHGK